MSRVLVVASLFFLLAACDKDPSRPPGSRTGRVVVLNGQEPTGLSLLGESGSVQSSISFEDFDGASFSLRNDTVASTASALKGDLLYVADLKSGSVLKVQLPGASNPAGVAFGTGSDGAGTMLYVALRNTGSVARVSLASAGGPPAVQILTGAGLCPADVVVSSSAVWSLDANQHCSGDYSIAGPSRLVPIASLGASDTINFPGAVVGAQRAFVLGDYAYVMAAGNYFSLPGSVTKVDLPAGNTVTVTLPEDRYAVSFRIGQDGHAYVTAAQAYPAAFAPQVYAVHLETMTFGGPRALPEPHLRLRKSDGAQASCFAATADANGNIYCLENGNALSTLLVFDPSGQQIRSSVAGSLAYDLTLR